MPVGLSFSNAFFRLTLTIHNVKTHYPRVLHRRNGIPIAIYDHPSFAAGNPSSDRMSLVVVGRCRRCLSSPCAAEALIPFPSGLPVGELRGLLAINRAGAAGCPLLECAQEAMG